MALAARVRPGEWALPVEAVDAGDAFECGENVVESVDVV